jgi:hypothetical protein
VEKYCRVGQTTDDSIIRHMGLACWVIEATNTQTHTEFNTYCFFAEKMVTRTRLFITLYVQCFLGRGLNFSGSEYGPATRFKKF